MGITFDPSKYTAYRPTLASRLNANGLHFKMWGKCAILTTGEIPVTVMELHNSFLDIAFYPGSSMKNLIDYIKEHQHGPASVPDEFASNAIYSQIDCSSSSDVQIAWHAVHHIKKKLEEYKT